MTTTNLATGPRMPRPASPPGIGAILYRFQGTLGPLNPVGIFGDGLRFHNTFEGQILDGPFTGGRISGPDFFLLRPDGVGEIHAPELIEWGAHRVSIDVRGYVLPPEGIALPPLPALLEPGFELPDVAFRVTGSAFAATASPEFGDLNGTTIVIEGTVNMGTGELDVTARAVDPPAPAREV